MGGNSNRALIEIALRSAVHRGIIVYDPEPTTPGTVTRRLISLFKSHFRGLGHAGGPTDIYLSEEAVIEPAAFDEAGVVSIHRIGRDQWARIRDFYFGELGAVLASQSVGFEGPPSADFLLGIQLGGIDAIGSQSTLLANF